MPHFSCQNSSQNHSTFLRNIFGHAIMHLAEQDCLLKKQRFCHFCIREYWILFTSDAKITHLFTYILEKLNMMWLFEAHWYLFPVCAIFSIIWSRGTDVYADKMYKNCHRKEIWIIRNFNSSKFFYQETPHFALVGRRWNVTFQHLVSSTYILTTVLSITEDWLSECVSEWVRGV